MSFYNLISSLSLSNSEGSGRTHVRTQFGFASYVTQLAHHLARTMIRLWLFSYFFAWRVALTFLRGSDDVLPVSFDFSMVVQLCLSHGLISPSISNYKSFWLWWKLNCSKFERWKKIVTFSTQHKYIMKIYLVTDF